MSDTFASALEGQAIATLISSLRGKIANVRNNQQLEALVIQMQDAYEKRISLLLENAELLQKSTDSYKSLAEHYKDEANRNRIIAQNNFDKGSAYKKLLEQEREANSSMKLELLTALSEGVIYKAVASAARQALASEPGARQRTLAAYRQTVVQEVQKGLEIIKQKNGEEMYSFAKKYVKWAAAQRYLSDVSEELNKNFQFLPGDVTNSSPDISPNRAQLS